MAEGHSPLAQFEIKRLVPMELGGVDVSFTNSSLFMIIVIAAVTLFLTLSMRGRAMVPGRMQSMAELSYEFIANMLKENVGSEGRKYFPFIFTVFMFVLFCNLIGMIPYAFTVTSHIVVTFGLALTVFVTVTLIGIFRHGFKFLGFFVPKGVPAILLVLLIPIEVLSYFVRPISLSVRLFANMLAGHTVLGALLGLAIAARSYPIAGVTVVGCAAISLLELFVAFLQAYIFTYLTTMFIGAAVHPDH